MSTSNSMTCSVSKRVAPGTEQDLDLNDDYYVIYGRRRGPSSSGSLRIRHEENPVISSETLNPVTVQSVDDGSVPLTFPKIPLLKFHGILMIIAWPVLALCGIFFTTWMRQALPNGEWFQVNVPPHLSIALFNESLSILSILGEM